MGTLATILSAIVAIAKAVVAGLAFKHEQDFKAQVEHETQALNRHEADSTAIDDAIARGVRDAEAARRGSGPAAS